MNNKPELFKTLPFYFFSAGVFLMIVCKDIFSNGMFLDGIIYSTVSKNLADGIGTFWNPHFTSTCLSEFHEHPPLAFGIQSVFYKLLGESRFIERLYSLLTVVIVGCIILKIWKTLGYKYGWLPILLWLITPTVFWASYSNLLENTLTVFTSLSVLFYLINQENKNSIFIFLSGFTLALGFLTKGFVAFFPWTFPFLLWLFIKQKSIGKMLSDSILIIVFTIVPLVLLILLVPDARLSLHKYIDNQVIGSLRNVVTVDSRLNILKILFSELVPAAGLCILLLIWGLIKRYSTILLKENIKKALAFASVGLTGVIPIMISMKQSGFYIIPAYPFFAIGISILLYPLIDTIINKIDYDSRGFLCFKFIAYGLFFTAILLSFIFSDQYNRDKEKIADIKAILPGINKGAIINISPDMYSDWYLHAYFGRFKNISLDPDLNNVREYLLIKNEYYSDTLSFKYEIVKLNIRDYQLFRLKH
jgi:4-amino-4-deoxy-L-arabinose transferase-like glycosyltransferase